MKIKNGKMGIAKIILLVIAVFVLVIVLWGVYSWGSGTVIPFFANLPFFAQERPPLEGVKMVGLSFIADDDEGGLQYYDGVVWKEFPDDVIFGESDIRFGGKIFDYWDICDGFYRFWGNDYGKRNDKKTMEVDFSGLKEIKEALDGNVRYRDPNSDYYQYEPGYRVCEDCFLKWKAFEGVKDGDGKYFNDYEGFTFYYTDGFAPITVVGFLRGPITISNERSFMFLRNFAFCDEAYLDGGGFFDENKFEIVIVKH